MTDHPRPTSAVVASALTLVVIVALASSVGLVGAALYAIGGALALAGAGLLGAREDVPSLVASSALFVAAVACSVVAAVTAALVVFDAIYEVPTTGVLIGRAWQSFAFVLAVGIAAFGAWTIPRQGSIADASRSLANTATIVCTVLAVALGAVWFGRGDVPEIPVGDLTDEALSAVVEPGTATPALGTFLVLAGAAAFAVASLLLRLPVATFADRERREEVRDAVELTCSRTHRFSIVAVAVGSLVAFLPDSLWDRVREELSSTAYDWLVSVTTSPGLRRAFVWSVVLSIAIVLAVAVVRRLRREYLRGPAVLAARSAGGLLLVGGIYAIGPESLLDRIADRLPDDPALVLDEVVAEVGTEPVVLAGVLAGALVVSLLLFAVGALGVARIVPPGTASAVVAAVGIGAATVLGGLLDEPSALSFAAIAIAVVVWDAGAYGQRLGAELGAAPTRRAELVHTGVTLLVGLIAAVAVSLAASTVRTAAEGTVALVALVALVAAVLLAATLRG